MLMALLLLAACQTVVPIESDRVEKRYTGTLRVGLHGMEWKLDPYPPGGKNRTAHHLFQTRAAKFLEENPGVHIEFIDIDYERNFQSLLEDPSKIPDVIELTVNEARLPMREHIMSLAELVEDQAEQWQGDYMRVIELAELSGEPYLLPVKSEPMLTFYLADKLEAAQLEAPREGWTWNDYIEIGQGLLAEGYSIWSPPTLNDIEPFIRGFGGAYADANHRIAGTLDSAATVHAFARYAEIMNTVSSTDQFMGGGAFESRALILGRASDINAVFDRASIAPLPDAPDGRRYNNSLMTGLAIAKTSKQQDLAWTFMKFMLGETSEMAMEAVAAYTLDAEGSDHSFQPAARNPQKLDDLKRWLMHEITISPPATFNYGWRDDYFHDSTAPSRTIPQLYAYRDFETAQADLKLWAMQIETYAEAFAGQGATAQPASSAS